MAGLKLRVLFSAGDQVLSSVSNALILFAMAGPSSVSEFGLAILVFSILTAALGFVRGAVGTPLLLMSAFPSRGGGPSVVLPSSRAHRWECIQSHTISSRLVGRRPC